jgi:hypothetical protein
MEQEKDVMVAEKRKGLLLGKGVYCTVVKSELVRYSPTHRS